MIKPEPRLWLRFSPVFLSALCGEDFPFRIPKSIISKYQSASAATRVPVHNRFFLIVFFAFFLLPCLSRTAAAQITTQRPDMGTPMTDEDEARARITHDMEKKAAKERVAALKNDTDKLLKLSIELKTYVDKSNENVLSVDVVKKAEEIEKLAKSVKDKMKGPN